MKPKIAAGAGAACLLAAAAIPLAENGILNRPPDPVKLLAAVAQARQRITSGELEFDQAIYDLDRRETGRVGLGQRGGSPSRTAQTV